MATSPPMHHGNTPSLTTNRDLQAQLDQFTDRVDVEMEENGRADQKLFNFKISLKLSVDAAKVDDGKTVKNILAKFIIHAKSRTNGLFKNKEHNVIDISTLPNDPDEFKKYVGWETSNSRNYKNVHICISVASNNPFKTFKNEVFDYVKSNNIWIERNPALGPSFEEMIPVAMLAFAHPDLYLPDLQKAVNTAANKLIMEKTTEWRLQHISANDKGPYAQFAVTHGQAKGDFDGETFVNNRAIILKCPKRQFKLHQAIGREAVASLGWSKDSNKWMFVPMILKQQDTTDLFAKIMMGSNEATNKKGALTISGISYQDMARMKKTLIAECQAITHVDSTYLTNKTGQWRLIADKHDLDTVEKWAHSRLEDIHNALVSPTPITGQNKINIRAKEISAMLDSEQIQHLAASVDHQPKRYNPNTIPGIKGAPKKNQGRKSNVNSAWNAKLRANGPTTNMVNPNIPANFGTVENSYSTYTQHTVHDNPQNVNQIQSQEQRMDKILEDMKLMQEQAEKQAEESNAKFHKFEKFMEQTHIMQKQQTANMAREAARMDRMEASIARLIQMVTKLTESDENIINYDTTFDPSQEPDGWDNSSIELGTEDEEMKPAPTTGKREPARTPPKKNTRTNKSRRTQENRKHPNQRNVKPDDEGDHQFYETQQSATKAAPIPDNPAGHQ